MCLGADENTVCLSLYGLAISDFFCYRIRFLKYMENVMNEITSCQDVVYQNQFNITDIFDTNSNLIILALLWESREQLGVYNLCPALSNLADINPLTAISTHRVKARPVSFELLAIGLASPYHEVTTLAWLTASSPVK
jgi:hypothetical protein